MASTVRFPEEIMERVKGEADRRGLTLNALLTVAVLEWLENHPLGPLVVAHRPQVNVRTAPKKAGRKVKKRGRR